MPAVLKRPAKQPASEPPPAAKKPRGTGTASQGVDGKAAAKELFSALREPGWRASLREEFTKEYVEGIAGFLKQERNTIEVFPAEDKVFEALNVTPWNDVKVVIIGQDPYHEPGQACGLSFSVPKGIRPPPSLKNMYKELLTDVPGFEIPDHGDLVPWARQGVLLLNATLTVRCGHKEANSHSKCGWQAFTDAIIEALNRHPRKLIFLLWGGFAQKKGKIVDKSRHVVIESAHPSPLSFKKWQGCKTFSKCNKALKEIGMPGINWALDSAAEASVLDLLGAGKPKRSTAQM